MANDNSAKGNPASHRMSNPNHKAVRAVCWQRGEKRKAKRREENERAAAANRKLIAEHGHLVSAAPGNRQARTAQKIRNVLAGKPLIADTTRWSMS